MTTEATLVCTCEGECGGNFRFVGEGDEATEKMPFTAGEGLIAVRHTVLRDHFFLSFERHCGKKYIRNDERNTAGVQEVLKFTGA